MNEERLRAKADRRGLALQRGAGANGMGYMLTEWDGFRVAAGGDPEPFGLSLSDGASYLDAISE